MFALQGANSGELLSYGGKVLVHDNARELEYLVPRGAKVVRCPRMEEDQVLSIRLHPDLATVRWPLRKEDFR